MTRDEIQATLSQYLQEMFEIPAEKITPEARLFEELDLDSIDAVDLVVRLQDLTGKKIKPEQFKTVRTVADVVDRVHDLFTE
ncbi:acyl carrier protein [Magnetospirillum sp. UT-4]|uniref:acyl carrier protein n=1 Tax=Magnetospirillum sp. UT-4 TaxID=2681467 RepID=UPI0013805C87|nr:acyl carrier protein [Magnetospirillum sp. UT-4]CAA7626558.1 Acyl carrier protein 2 [Magnetospirillum sp. UT-4]